VRDAFQAWKQGIPAVVLVHEPFATLAKAQCQALGAKDPVTLVYKQDAPARESDEESTAKARHVAAEVVRLLSSAARV
jgi:ketosteroid isomerase-like protein